MKRTHEGLFVFWSINQRITHIALFLTVTMAALSGMPLKYHEFYFGVYVFNLFGSYDAVNMTHHGVGLLIVAILIYHLGSAVYVWIRTEKYRKVIQMKFTKNDLKDIINFILYLLFIKKKPKYGRYTLFQKFDYFISLILLITLAVTGLIMAFPIITTSLISISWLPICSKAHSSISVLFIIYIIFSHLFNTHYHPDKLYLNLTWLSGTLNDEEMKDLHYLEYMSLLQKEVELREEYKKKAEVVSKEAKVKKEKMMLEDYLNEGNALAKAGEYDLAIDRYKEAIKIYPNYSQARFNLAVVYKKNKQFQEAIAIFNEFVIMDPFNQMVDVAKNNIKELKERIKNPPLVDEITDLDE